jgi:hypothetical protein
MRPHDKVPEIFKTVLANADRARSPEEDEAARAYVLDPCKEKLDAWLLAKHRARQRAIRR